MEDFQVYGYTDAFQGDYSELVYLRSRQYSPGLGRFLTRDTWSGDENQPGSFNRWNYTYSNPINLTDPTGFSPECSLVYGYTDNSYLKCEKIISGLNPLNSMTLVDLSLFDEFVNCSWDIPYFKILNIPGYRGDKSESYGFWFHYLQNEKWKKTGHTGSISISTILSYVLGAESNVPSLYADIMPNMVRAMAIKSQAVGVYKAIGSRQVVRADLDPYLFLSDWSVRIQERNENGNGVYHFDEILKDYIQNGRDWGRTISEGLTTEVGNTFKVKFDLSRGTNNLPDDWGNVTKYTQTLPIYAALRTLPYDSTKYNLDPSGVYWRSDPRSDDLGQFFIVTPNQVHNLCTGGYSCVSQD